MEDIKTFISQEDKPEEETPKEGEEEKKEEGEGETSTE